MKENKGEQPEQERDERVYRAADIASKKDHPSTQRQNYFREGFIEGVKYAAAQPSKVQEKEIEELKTEIELLKAALLKTDYREELERENALLEAREVAWQNKHSFLTEEIQRLKGLIDIAYSTGKYAGHHLAGSEEERYHEQFKTKNRL